MFDFLLEFSKQLFIPIPHLITYILHSLDDTLNLVLNLGQLSLDAGNALEQLGPNSLVLLLGGIGVALLVNLNTDDPIILQLPELLLELFLPAVDLLPLPLPDVLVASLDLLALGMGVLPVLFDFLELLLGFLEEVLEGEDLAAVVV